MTQKSIPKFQLCFPFSFSCIFTLSRRLDVVAFGTHPFKFARWAKEPWDETVIEITYLNGVIDFDFGRSLRTKLTVGIAIFTSAALYHELPRMGSLPHQPNG
jgi:hypothetical protein